MVSINNISVNRAVLASLRQTNADLATAQSRIASGLKVASAADNASVFATAQTIRSDINAQDGIDGSLGIAKGQADAANVALGTIADLLQKIKTAGAGLADGSGTSQPNNVTIQSQIKTYVDQILTVAKGASLQGVNLLTGTGTVTPTIGQDNGSAITASFTLTQMLSSNGSAGSLSTVYGYGTGTITATMTAANVSTVQTAIDTAISAVNTYTTQVTSYANSLTSQQDFYGKLKDIRANALSSLVDANMEEESARVQALQVKQQLAYQALSLGNSSAQNILRLFQ